jgi:hypothetical protein
LETIGCPFMLFGGGIAVKFNRKIRLSALLALTLALVLLPVRFTVAQGDGRFQPGEHNIRELRGTWFATLSGVTGCGVSTLVTTFTLDASGNGTQVSSIEHTAACGDIDQSGLLAQVQAFHTDGSGFIAFGCGQGCGFGFTIQVSRNRDVFNLGPQSVPGNYLAGVAVRK